MQVNIHIWESAQQSSRGLSVSGVQAKVHRGLPLVQRACCGIGHVQRS